MEKRKILFTSESVSEGHPDKVCDQISDAVLDACLAVDEKSHVACEVFATNNEIIIAGEITSKCKPDYVGIVKDVLKRIGYDRPEVGTDYHTVKVEVKVKEQSPDINQGVDKKTPEEQGAGDQGIMFGYATNETEGYMPLAISIAHKLVREATAQRQADYAEYAGYSMENAGVYNLSANYYYTAGALHQTAGNTVREFVTINVNGSIDPGVVPELLEVWGDKKTEYTVGDTFEVPAYVYVDYSDGSWSNVPYECTYTGYDLNTPGTYTVLVSYTYNGVTVTDSYTITVTASGQQKEPDHIEVLYATTEYNVGDSFDTPSVALYYTDGSSKNISYDCLYEGYDMNTPGTYTVEVTYFEGNFVDYTTYTITVTGDPVDPNTITFDTSLTSGGYSTGNYGTRSANGYSFTYYRTTDYSGYVANLLPATCNYGDPIGGSIANVDPIPGIDSVTIKYSNTSKSGATAGKLSYGVTNTLDGSLAIPYSTSDNTVTLNIPGGANFIKIESGNTKLALKEFTVHYTNSGSSYYTPINAYTNNYRVNPNKYTGTLVAGSSSVTVPVSVSYSSNRYTVLQSKTYTYYTLDYVESHPSIASAAAMTDPVDVANYYSIFGEIPANFGGKSSGMNSVSDVRSVFGSDTRQVSYYSRTDGYATAVPNINASQGYYEFDIDVDGNYSTSSRGVGRVVAWIKGINNSAYGSGSYRVCHFTDDHYATFQEFNNLGQFLPKFDAERQITGKKWSCPNTAYAA